MFLVFALFLWQASFAVTKIDVEGLSRFKPESVLATVGLKAGGQAGKAEFDGACQRLIESGLFQSCNWKYAPVSNAGVALTLQLQEAPALQTVRLSLAGVDEKQLWEWLRTNEPLVQPQMPDSDAALQFYTKAIQRYLKREVVPSTHTNLETKENTLVFRPADVPSIQSVKFSGAQAISSASLEKALSAVAIGTPATEYDVQQLLDLNIRPMYENLGHLAVQFSSIRFEGGAVTVDVQEGAVYTLAKAQATGASGPSPKFRLGQRAEWNQIVDAAESAAATLRNNGFLNAKYRIDRQLHPETKTVDITVAYTPGQQFTFNALQLQGLNVPQETNVRALWKLPAGAPMNAAYVEEFLRSAVQKLGPEFSSITQQMEPASPSSMNVVIGFKRK